VRGRARRIAFVVATTVIVACNGILGIEDRKLRGGPSDVDAKTDDVTTAEVGPMNDGSVVDAADAAPRLDGGPGLVVIVPGPGGYAIDEREVTVAEYAAFVTPVAYDAGSPKCLWKMTNAPAGGCTANTQGNQPVVCIDWCDALAYCTSVGKRLCGRRGTGGAQDVSAFADPATDEWTFACAGGSDANRFCYGPNADPTKCNTTAFDAGAMTAVGSLPGCIGSSPYLFDMSGNAWEWENACLDSGAAPMNEGCAFRGGASRNPINDSKCLVGTFLPRSAASQDVGFRCCKDL
jgi:formylglycine-generating enzyme